MDNDVYGHVNNVVFYSYFDTVINEYLVRAGGLDYADGEIVGLAVETGCRFHAPVSFPAVLDAALRVVHLGRTSVRYEVGIFVPGVVEAVADGHFTHVFVRRDTGRPEPPPEALRVALAAIAQS